MGCSYVLALSAYIALSGWFFFSSTSRIHTDYLIIHCYVLRFCSTSCVLCKTPLFVARIFRSCPLRTHRPILFPISQRLQGGYHSQHFLAIGSRTCRSVSMSGISQQDCSTLLWHVISKALRITLEKLVANALYRATLFEKKKIKKDYLGREISQRFFESSKIWAVNPASHNPCIFTDCVDATVTFHPTTLWLFFSKFLCPFLPVVGRFLVLELPASWLGGGFSCLGVLR